MKSDTRLDSAVFQLTPTRTRCDLVIIANGKTEKIASGLLDPFLAHLKAARDQIAKGGYSITLEPGLRNDAMWFTKDTVERFVRFVSTPEVLERVNTIESEMLQIDEAIVIQGNDNLGLSTVEDDGVKSTETTEGNKHVYDADAEKAIVLFKPGLQPPESNGSTTLEENSKVKLLRVLETRKTVLQKEQGMAFARAVAAGFDMDHMTHLLSFAEYFGASRLMEASIKFRELWKRKHETGQWLEIEATEAISSRTDFSSINASGIVFSGEVKKQKEFREARYEPHNELGTEGNGKTSNDATMGSQHLSSDNNGDKRPPLDSQVPLGAPEYFQGHFQHPMYPQWPMHSPSGAPVFQAYPMQGMPYYQASGPFFQPPYPPMEDPRFNGAHRMGQKRHSMDSKDSNVESGASNGRSQDSTDQSMSEKEVVQGHETKRKNGRSGKAKSGMVVIRNINYITSKRDDTSGSESHSTSESDEDAEELQSDAPKRKHKNSLRSSKNRGSLTKSADTWNSNDRDDVAYEQQTDDGNWQAFQNFLLRDGEESTSTVDRGMFSAETEAPIKKRQNTTGSDPIIDQQDTSDASHQQFSKFDAVSGNGTRIYKQRVSNDDFMLYGQRTQSVSNSHSDPLVGNEFGHADKLEKSSSHNVTDESFIVPFRSSPQDQVRSEGRTAIDIGLEFPSNCQIAEDSSHRLRSQLSYEPDVLSLMPVRSTEGGSAGYDPAVDYEMEVRAEDAIAADNGNQEDGAAVKEGLKKLEKGKKSRLQDALEKRKMEAAMRKGKPSKMNHLTEAQVRAERLRAYKADLQKMKREKEEEEMKRLEGLKRERQRRIAARSNTVPAQSSSPSLQSKSRLPAKLSPGLNKGSKFSDAEPGSSSPLQRLPSKVTSAAFNDPQKTAQSSRLNTTRLAGNGLSRSVSSLPDLKKENDVPEPKSIPVRTRRLSDPKGSGGHHASLKSGGSGTLPKPKVPDEREIKKISAIMSLDKTKTATLPELKIRTSRSNSDATQNKSASKEIKQRVNGNKPSLAPETIKPKKSDDKIPPYSNGGDNPVIEKTVVMLEHDIPAVPALQASVERKEDKKEPYEDASKIDTVEVTEYASIHPPAPSIRICEEDKDPSKLKLDEHSNSNKVIMDNTSDELPKSSNISFSEKPYQAPYARVSSLEDPCTSNSEYNKAPLIGTAMETITETVKAHVSDFTDINSPVLISESLEKSRGRESSKGFRRLLKFGRKNHSSAMGEHSADLDKLSIDSSVIDDHYAATSSSNEVPTLKNLISQDESHVSTNSHKVSRHFSLLSPFRSKNNEKSSEKKPIQRDEANVIYKV